MWSKISQIALLILFFYPGFTQTVNILSLEGCYSMAQTAHPLQKQVGVLRQSTAIKVEQIQAGRLPDLQWNSRARLQSDVVKFPLEFPGIAIPELPLYSIQSSVDAAYLISDGGIAQARKNIENAALPAEEQAVQVELDRLKPGINDLFFGILLAREREAILRSSLDNLHARRTTVEAAVRHGAALPGDVDRIAVEILRMENRITETQNDARALLAALSVWIQTPLEEDVALQLPDLSGWETSSPAQRAEHRLFELQKQRLAASETLVAAANRPKLNAWAQVGLGYPNPFNFFDNDLSPFGAIGLAFTWRIHDWKQSKRDRQLLTLQAVGIDNQRAAFDRQLEAQQQQLIRQIEDMTSLLVKDEAIVALQTRILHQIEAQLERGVATTTEYIEQENAVAQARMTLKNRELQRQLLQVGLLTVKGAL